MTERTVPHTEAPADDFAVRPRHAMAMLHLDGVDPLTIMEFVPVGAAVVGPGLVIHYTNRRLRELLGLAESLSYPLDGTQLFADRHPALDFDSLIRSWQSEGTFECELRRDNSEPLWVLTSARKIRLAGAPASIVWFQDVTASRQATIAVQELRQAQSELIQAEKMAALGSLVAGVAHEINTPIGNTLTAASHLYDRAQAFRTRLDTEKIRKTDLTGFFDMFEITARLILRDTERAIELIQSFKQVAVDQTSGERREFDLKRYIEEVLLSLRPRIRRTKIAVGIDCPPDILMDSYPGALSQVLTNFVMNSLMHAYNPQDSGRLRIEVAQPRPGQVELVYSDDGKGMPRDVLEHIFDPFFTTKRGSGGSGLGMHIVYNIVTTTLRGTIRVESEVGSGARFIVRMPLSTPAQATRAAPKAASAQSAAELNASAENN